MKRFLCVVVGLGVLAAFGGVGFLYLQNYNVLSGRLWSAAFRGMIDQPFALIGALDDPARRDLAAGLLATFGGVAVAAGGLVLLNIHSIAMALVGAAKRRRAQAASAERKTPKVSKKPKQESRFTLPKLRLPKLAKGGFRDEMADLEGGQKKRKMGDLIEKLRGMIPTPKPKRTTQIVIQSGNEKKVVAEITEDTEFYTDLKSWHQKVKASSGADLGLIEEAKALRERQTKAVASAVLEEDPMNGEFLMRMMAAWAEKSMTPIPSPRAADVVRPSGPDEVMSAAIDEVMRNGVSEEEDESEGIDLDDESFLPEHLFEDIEDDNASDEDDDDLDDPASMLDIDPTEDRDVDLDDEEEGEGFLNPELFSDEGDKEAEAATNNPDGDADPVEQEGSSEEALEVDLKAVRELITTVSEIEQGFGEWPEYLQAESDRVAQLENAMMSISEQIDTTPKETVKEWLDDNAGSPEWDWLAENLDRLDEERRDILETIVENGSAESGAGDEDDESTPTADVAEEDEIDDWSVTAAPAVSKSDPEPAVETQQDDPEVDHDETNEDAPENEPEEAIEEAKEETVETPAQAAEVAPEVEPEVREQDFSLDQLAEVEMCDDLLTKWGYSARGAGASEAKLVHTIVAKNGVKRKVVGVVHMVAGWKGDTPGDNRRLNVIFRYVPEGNWRFDTTNGVQFIDERDNFVRVAQELLDHPELASQKAVIHFYGPGVGEELREQISDRVLVVGKALNTDEVTEFVFG